MVKIEAVIHPFKLDDVQAALQAVEVDTFLISEVADHGCASGQTSTYRGVAYRIDTPKLKLEMLVSPERADQIVDAIRIRTGVHLQYVLA